MMGPSAPKPWPMFLGAFAILLTFLTSQVPAQTESKTNINTRTTTTRLVKIPSTVGQPEIVVTEFFTHGELRDDGSNLIVSTDLDHPVPWRIMQVGPGDFCRVAIQTVPKRSAYKIAYGGNSLRKSPEWTCTSGLVLETCRYSPCDLDNLTSVRKAFESAKPIGGDFVANVFHAYNPTRPEPEPFLSIYRGKLYIKTAGNYQFFTSSQDCSFLIIDGEQVVAAPGAHGPVSDARIRGDISLTAGAHSFEYLHAASGRQAYMVAAWQTPEGHQPEIIPAEAFHSSKVAHITPGRPYQGQGALRDFTYEVLGEVTLPGSDLPLIRVQFKENATTTTKARAHWEFGDGLTADESDPIHIFLHPGLFTIKAGGAFGKTVNRVYIHHGAALPQTKKGPDQLVDYVPVLLKCDSQKLDALSALQLVRFCEQVEQHKRAVQIGKAWLLAKTAPQDDRVVHSLAETVGPMLRFHFGDSASALAVWQATAALVQQNLGRKSACEMEAADIFLNDLLDQAKASEMLEAATSHLAGNDNPILVSRLNRLWGDWHARAGKKKEALADYAKAAAQSRQRTSAERDAHRGAYSRSTEAFLRDKALNRASEELHRWQDEFPQDKVDGYLPLLLARYYAACAKFQHGIVVCNDLVAVNAESPYADQLVFLAAECEEKLKQPSRARAAYQALITDYPGSPLLKEAKKKLLILANAESGTTKIENRR